MPTTTNFYNEGGGGGPFVGAPSNILVTNNDLATTAVTSNPDAFVTANLTTQLVAPVTGYDADFKSAGANIAEVEHVGTVQQSYRVDFSGTITATDPAFLDTYIGLKVASDSGQEFTGGIKFYPVGVSFGGASPAIGFSTVVFGSIAPGEKLSVQMSSNTAGNLILTDLIMFAVKITPAG